MNETRIEWISQSFDMIICLFPLHQASSHQPCQLPSCSTVEILIATTTVLVVHTDTHTHTHTHKYTTVIIVIDNSNNNKTSVISKKTKGRRG